jgi:hypothetical protein
VERSLEQEARQEHREEELLGQRRRRQEVGDAEAEAGEDERDGVRNAQLAREDRDRSGDDEQEDEDDFEARGVQASDSRTVRARASAAEW